MIKSVPVTGNRASRSNLASASLVDKGKKWRRAEVSDTKHLGLCGRWFMQQQPEGGT